MKAHAVQRRMRIGIDFHTFDGIFQGSRSHIAGLFAEAIRLAPHMDFVFFLKQTEKLRSFDPAFTASNVELARIPKCAGLVRLALVLPFFRLRHRVSLLHTQYRIPPVALGPCACTIHDVLFESHPEYFGRFFSLQSRASFRFAVRNASLLFTVSEFSRGEISTRYGIREDDIVVLHNAVDRNRFFPGDQGVSTVVRYGLTPGKYLLTVGRLEPRKNHANLFRAYAALPASTPPLVVVGQRDFGYANLTKLIQSLGITGQVRFLETVGDADLPDIMRHAAVFIYPSMAEGFGMPVIEAMACGLPVVTSNTSALAEVAGNAAELINPADPQSIADAIERILDNDGRREELKQLALVRADRFCWSVAARLLIDTYEAFYLSSSIASVARSHHEV